MARRRRPKHLIEKAIVAAILFQSLITILQSLSAPGVVSHYFFEILHNSDARSQSNVSLAADVGSTNHDAIGRAQLILKARQEVLSAPRNKPSVTADSDSTNVASSRGLTSPEQQHMKHAVIQPEGKTPPKKLNSAKDAKLQKLPLARPLIQSPVKKSPSEAADSAAMKGHKNGNNDAAALKKKALPVLRDVEKAKMNAPPAKKADAKAKDVLTNQTKPIQTPPKQQGMMHVAVHPERITQSNDSHTTHVESLNTTHDAKVHAIPPARPLIESPAKKIPSASSNSSTVKEHNGNSGALPVVQDIGKAKVNAPPAKKADPKAKDVLTNQTKPIPTPPKQQELKHAVVHTERITQSNDSIATHVESPNSANDAKMHAIPPVRPLIDSPAKKIPSAASNSSTVKGHNGNSDTAAHVEKAKMNAPPPAKKADPKAKDVLTNQTKPIPTSAKQQEMKHAVVHTERITQSNDSLATHVESPNSTHDAKVQAIQPARPLIKSPAKKIPSAASNSSTVKGHSGDSDAAAHVEKAKMNAPPAKKADPTAKDVVTNQTKPAASNSSTVKGHNANGDAAALKKALPLLRDVEKPKMNAPPAKKADTKAKKDVVTNQTKPIQTPPKQQEMKHAVVHPERITQSNDSHATHVESSNTTHDAKMQAIPPARPLIESPAKKTLLEVSNATTGKAQNHQRGAATQKALAVVQDMKKAKMNAPPAPAKKANAKPKDVLTNVTGPIPHRLIFTYKTNLLETKFPTRTYANLQELIEVYKTAWHNDVEIWFLNDTECRSVIQQVEPKLVKGFDEEPRGDFRGDICRIAALTLKGGYYLDVDLKVVEPLIVPDNVAFSSARSRGRELFFQAFLASVPNHPILAKSLEYLIRVYGETDPHQLVGPATTFQAYDTVHKQLPTDSLWILEEFQMHDGDYPDVPRQDGSGLYCNYVIHDDKQKQVYFYSRFVGASKSCMAKCDNKEGEEGDCRYEHDHLQEK